MHWGIFDILLFYIEIYKDRNVVEVLAWNMPNFSSFKSTQDSPNEVEQRDLLQKKKNLMSSIFGHFDLMQWW